jgi:hypothetical protein
MEATPKSGRSRFMKPEPPMARDHIYVRAVVDKRTASILERLAKSEGRSAQMQSGIILRRIATLLEKNPGKLLPLGIVFSNETLAACA